MHLNHFSKKYRLRVRRAEDGEAVIKGRHGQIYFHSDGVLGALLMPNGNRPRLWANARRRLEAAGCTVWQDGDVEGSALFDPNHREQVQLALRLAGVRRKRRAKLSPNFLAARKRSQFKPRTVEEGPEEAKSRGISPRAEELVEVGV